MAAPATAQPAPREARRVLVLGLGTFGGQLAVCRHFAREGWDVLVTDRKPREKLESSVAELGAFPSVRFHLGEEPTDVTADLVVRSPAVPLDHPLLQRARARGIPVTTEIARTLATLRAAYTAVTGTKGKSTTTALLGAILEEQHGHVHVGGNIGRPLLESAAAIDPAAPVVFELSSFMAEDLALARAQGERVPAPRLLVFTSLAPEHLDRHGTKDAYYQAKLSLLEGMSGPVVFADEGELGTLVRAKRDAVARGSAAAGPRLLPVSLSGAPGSVVRLDGDRVVHVETGRTLFQRGDVRLAGEHNVQNAALAAVASLELGCSPEAIRRAVSRFEALPHRLETVARDAEGRAFVNDSIATTPEAAQAALAAYPGRPVVILLGGSDKGSDLRGLAASVAAAAVGAVCFGATGEKIAALVSEAVAARGVLGGLGPRVVGAGKLEDAVAIARELCPSGGVVLLAPACASYDQFKNFEERGERFRVLARGER